MSQPARLLDLLPAVHRVRDAERAVVVDDDGNVQGPLEALLGLLDGELDVLREDVDRLYDAWFIETCDEWLVPYIGDLLGVRGLRDVREAGLSQRSFVANTIRYRRRKGTAAVLEELARDVTGWPAKVVEFFALLGWTQQLNHVRPRDGGTVELRSASPLELIDGPFDLAAHTADVRHVDNARGRHNIPNLGIFLWRLGAYALSRTSARPIAGHAGAYRFNPLGLDGPLFNIERPRDLVTDPTAEPNVPGPVRRRALYDELSGISSGEDRYFADVDPVLAVWVDGVRLTTAELAICNLEDPDKPLASGIKASLDPELGRLRIRGATASTRVETSWAYGFAGDLGAGPYDRGDAFSRLFADPDRERRLPPVTWQRGVWGAAQASDTDVTTTLTAPLAEWEAPPFKSVGLIAVMDSRTYRGDLSIKVPGGTTLILAAGDWPDEDPSPLASSRRTGTLDPSGPRPHVLGDIEVRPTSGSTGSDPGTLVIDGLLVEGTITVRPGSLGRLWIRNCTVLPDPSGTAIPAPGAVIVEAGSVSSTRNSSLDVDIVRSSCGTLAITEFAQSVSLTDAIVRGGAGAGGPGAALGAHDPAQPIPTPPRFAPDASIERSTLLGGVRVRSIEASESIFAERVDVERRQQGCARCSYVPLDSRVPRRFRCQPSNHAQAARIVPAFVSTDPADPGYAQLHRDGPVELATGAEHGSEMGAFNFVHAAGRLEHLRTRIDEYLRFGLEAGVLFAT